ncbi:MAG TPA: transcription antitermination factor NusB [Chitinophagaceae bacterium]|nr:transcription antitermination factor NusB [Chitinophagaceae bacterium]
MISRRNIRVKVMQTLYVLDALNSPDAAAGAEKSLQQNLDQTETMFLYLLLLLTRVAVYAQEDARLRASKRLITEKDLNINTRIAENSLIRHLVQDAAFQKKVKSLLINHLPDQELVKKIYAELTASQPYLEYICHQERTDPEERQIIHHLFNGIMMRMEQLDQHLEDCFIHWPDDRDMVIQLVNHFLAKSGSFPLQELISPEKKQYAYELLRTVLEKKEYCLELIRPKLQNWDPDRIASIDMIIMQMGICEFLYFPTIPAKVTINEYIDIAKTYSTPESGHFVNGLLDNLLKDLESGGKIHKSDRGRP